MKIRGAIFDMDGTLTASMHVWKTIGSEFLKSRGITPKEDVDRRFCSMSVFEAVHNILKKDYDIPGDADEIIDSINRTVENKYRTEVVLKDGAEEFLEHLKGLGVRMCVATATDKYLADETLRRLGIRDYFGDIFTSRLIGAGKDKPDIYLAAVDFLGTAVSETAVFEDSPGAATTAKNAGFIVCGLHDESFAHRREELYRVADVVTPTLRGRIDLF